MDAQFLWILLVLVEVAQAEQPIFVPSATGLSDAPPENKQDWLHPVIFEPQNKIQLTHSTYQVMTFLDFTPFMNGFNNVQKYIKSFKEDISNPTYFSKIKHKSTNTGSSPLLDEQDFEAFMQSAYCQQLPPVTSTISTVTTTKPTTSDISNVTPSTSIAFSPSSPSRAHRRTLEFITEAAQELYAKGQLHIKPYAGYLKEKRKKAQTTESDL